MAYNPYGSYPYGSYPYGNYPYGYQPPIIIQQPQVVAPVVTPVVAPILTPRIATPAPRPILSSKKWSQDMTDLKIKISRSDGRITYAFLYGYAEWELAYREWFAWVEWIEDGSNPKYYRGQSLNKRLPLNSLLTINHDNVMFQYLGRKLIKK